MQALDAGMHHLILDTPQECAMWLEIAAHICAIMRHLLEDPATLQAAMEAEIRSALTQKASRTGGDLPSFFLDICSPCLELLFDITRQGAATQILLLPGSTSPLHP